jgi:hypothetical protein
MKVCGVDLTGNDAVVCLMSLTDGLYNLPECRAKRLSISNADDVEQLRKFQFDFVKLMEDYQVDHVVIRERMKKGKFAGGSVGFKLEAAIQLAEQLSVTLMTPSAIKEVMKSSRVNMDFNDTGLKQFQETAFNTAFAYLDK